MLKAYDTLEEDLAKLQAKYDAAMDSKESSYRMLQAELDSTKRLLTMAEQSLEAATAELDSIPDSVMPVLDYDTELAELLALDDASGLLALDDASGLLVVKP